MSTPQNSANNTEQRIDATLRLYAHAQPPANLEQRIHARLQHEPAHAHASLVNRLRDFFVAQRMIFASAAAALACCAIVVGSVQYSRARAFPATGIHVSSPGSGLGAASGTHIAPQPVPVPENAHSRSERRAAGGRATISRDTHKPKGVAVPESTQAEKP